MRVLITGSNGLVGRALKDILWQSENNAFIYYFCTRQMCDLEDYNETDSLFKLYLPEIVVHLASNVGGVYENHDNNYSFMLKNTRINMNIVELCKKYKVIKLINILSTCIFPDEKVEYPLTIDQIHNGLPHYTNIGYAFSKRFLHIFSGLNDISKTINIIPTNLYGENDNYNLKKGHVLPALIHKMYLAKYNNAKMSVKGNGSAIRQFLYAPDLARIIFYFITHTVKENVDIIVSPTQEYSIKDVAEKIKEIFEYSGEICYETKCENGQHKKSADGRLIYDYIPDFVFTQFEEGLKHTIENFIERYKNKDKTLRL